LGTNKKRNKTGCTNKTDHVEKRMKANHIQPRWVFAFLFC
jgi:hypothetical protein